MYARYCFVVLGFSIAACAGRSPAVLPPAPKEDVLAVAERFRIDATANEAAVADSDTMLRVRDAGSMEVAHLPKDKQTRERATETWDNLVPRFRDAAVMQTDPVAGLQDMADSLREARLKWVALATASDSIAFHKFWGGLEQRMLTGGTFAIRTLVWPTPVRVVERAKGHLRLATDWIEFRRISPREMRCAVVENAREWRAEQGSAIRLVADLHQTQGDGGKIYVRFEPRGLLGCMLSELGADRLAAFRFDVWNIANRTSSIGVPGVDLSR